MFNYTFLLFLCVLIPSFTPLFAGDVSGNITNTNNNWGTGGNVSSPVNVVGDVVIPSGTTLTVQAGTAIKSTRGAAKITVNGTLIINGTIDAFVDMAPVSLVFNSSATQSKIKFVKMISWSTDASAPANTIDILNGNVDIQHLEIQDFKTNGINIAGANSKVIINHATIGAKSRNFGNSNVAYSINIADDARNADITITNSILGCEHNDKQCGLAIRGGNSTTVTIKYTFIVGTRIGNSSQETSVYTNITPKVFDFPNMRYFLADYSPAIDAADPQDDFSDEPQPNGGRADCGYYGGTSEATLSGLQVRNPNARTELKHGNVYKITWWGGNYACSKDVHYSIDDGQTWQKIETAPVGDTSINWTVPTAKTQKALIRVTYATTNTVSGTSQPFAIDTTVATDDIDTNRVIQNPKYFTVIGYSGYRTGQYPGGPEPSEDEVREDFSKIKSYTHGVRIYGLNKVGSGYSVVKVCDELGLNAHVGIWINWGMDGVTKDVDTKAMDDAIAVLKENHQSIKSVLVGNEYLLRVEAGHLPFATHEQYLIDCITYVKSRIPNTIKVSTGESYPDWLVASDALPQAVDFVCWHVHPWWEKKEIGIAAEWAATAHEKMIARMAKANCANKKMVCAETGYPWGENPATVPQLASPHNQAQYLKDLHAYAYKVGLEYWFFEAFDEPWKASFEGGVGDKWGMWSLNREPREIITNIASLIPKWQMWEDPDLVATDIVKPENTISTQHNVVLTFDEIVIVDMRGRTIASMKTGLHTTVSYTDLIKATVCAPGVYLIQYRQKGKTIGSQQRMYNLVR